MRLTKKNLQEIWNLLDSASGNLEQAFNLMSQIPTMPEEVVDDAERIDFSAIVALKMDIEDLIERKDKK